MPSGVPVPEASAPRRILVADDNEDIRRGIARLLRPRRRSLSALAARVLPEGAVASPVLEAERDEPRFEVSAASSGEEAVATFRRARQEGKPIAVAFLDVRMPPGMDGARVARVLREEDDDVETVLITAYADRTIEELNEAAGGCDRLLYLRKPYEREEVRQLALSLSEKRLQRRALRAASERIELVLSSTQDGIVGLDASHRVVFANRAARELLGIEDGKSLWAELARGSPCALSGGAAIELARGRRAVEISDVARTREASSEVQGVLAVRDVTARKEIERLKDEFVQNTSHELRTPLVAVRGYLDLALDGKLGGLEPALARGLGVARRASARLLDLIDAILELSRLEACPGEGLAREPVDLSLVVERVVETVRPAALAKGLEIALAVEEGASPVLGDPRTLEIALRNLLGNAVKFTESGKVGLAVARDGERASVLVWDTGPGLPASVASTAPCFERFRQGDGGIARAKGGVGIGLSLVARILRLHGTEVFAANRVGGGTCFRFLLARATELARTKPATLVRRRVVVVVDPGEETRDFLRFALGAAGHEVRAAATLEDALALGDFGRADLALIDLGEDGEGAKAARSLADGPGALAPRIALLVSPGLDAARRDEAMRAAGADSFLEKPVSTAALSALLAASREDEAAARERAGLARDARGEAA